MYLFCWLFFATNHPTKLGTSSAFRKAGAGGSRMRGHFRVVRSHQFLFSADEFRMHAHTKSLRTQHCAMYWVRAICFARRCLNLVYFCDVALLCCTLLFVAIRFCILLRFVQCIISCYFCKFVFLGFSLLTCTLFCTTVSSVYKNSVARFVLKCFWWGYAKRKPQLC